MLATLKVTGVNKMEVQADNTTVIDVSFDILENGQVLESRRLNFPLTTTKDEIQAELQKFITNFNADRELAAKSAELDAANAQADQVIAELSGVEFSAEDTSEATPTPPTEPSTPEAPATPEDTTSTQETVAEAQPTDPNVAEAAPSTPEAPTTPATE